MPSKEAPPTPPRQDDAWRPRIIYKTRPGRPPAREEREREHLPHPPDRHLLGFDPSGVAEDTAEPEKQRGELAPSPLLSAGTHGLSTGPSTGLPSLGTAAATTGLAGPLHRSNPSRVLGEAPGRGTLPLSFHSSTDAPPCHHHHHHRLHTPESASLSSGTDGGSPRIGEHALMRDVSVAFHSEPNVERAPPGNAHDSENDDLYLATMGSEASNADRTSRSAKGELSLSTLPAPSAALRRFTPRPLPVTISTFVLALRGGASSHSGAPPGDARHLSPSTDTLFSLSEHSGSHPMESPTQPPCDPLATPGNSDLSVFTEERLLRAPVQRPLTPPAWFRPALVSSQAPHDRRQQSARSAAARTWHTPPDSRAVSPDADVFRDSATPEEFLRPPRLERNEAVTDPRQVLVPATATSLPVSLASPPSTQPPHDTTPFAQRLPVAGELSSTNSSRSSSFTDFG